MLVTCMCKLDAQNKQVLCASNCEKVINMNTHFLVTTLNSKVCTAFSANQNVRLSDLVKQNTTFSVSERAQMDGMKCSLRQTSWGTEKLCELLCQ